MADLIRRVFAPEKRTANLEALIQAAEAARGGGSSFAGVWVNEDSAMRHLTVWSCVSLLADTLAMLPLHTFGTTTNGFPERVDDPPVIVRPHSEMTRFAWHVRMAWAVLMRGNAFAEVIERGRGGLPLQLEPLHPDGVIANRNKTTGELEWLVGRERRPVAVENMLHVPGFTVPGSVYGLDPISYARQTIGTALAAEEYGGRFFSEGAVPPGVLSTDQKLDLDTALEYQTRWEEAHGNRRRRVAVLGGGLKYDAIQIAPEQSQFLATIGASRSMIAGFFRVPPHLIGDANNAVSAWGSGMAELGRSFATYSLGPWLSRFEAAWLDVLAPSGSLYARYNTAALLRSDLVSRYNAYRTAREGGWLNIDEIRGLEEMPPLEDDKGTDYLQPLNYAPIPAGGGAAAPSDVTPAPQSNAGG